MRISLCIAIIALSTAFASARPLIDDAAVASDPKIEWTDLMPSSNKNDMDTGSGSYYKEFEHAADQETREETQDEEEEGQANAYKPNSSVDLNQKATQLIRGDDVVEEKMAALDHGQLGSQTTAKEASSDKNSNSGVTKYAFDIIMKPSESEAQEPRSDTTLIDTEALGRDSSLPAVVDEQQALLPPTVQIDGDKEERERDEQEVEGTSSRFDFFDALDQALLDPYISGIDSDLNSEVYEAPVTETNTWQVGKNGEIPDYRSLIAEQIRSAEEEIRIKHDELIQDQQQIDDLKRKIHHSSTTTTFTSLPNPTFSMEVIESGPDETMYVYKHIPPTTPSAVTVQQQQPDLGTSVTHSPLLPTTMPDLETGQQEMTAEQNVPTSAVINHITPFYNLVQKQTDEEEGYYQAKIKQGSASAAAPLVNEAVDLVIPPHMGDTTFDPSNRLKLPNGNWTPSCKNVSKGLYCLQPDGQGSAIMECSGENVGFQFSCGKSMLCYSTGPFDVDCQKAQDFIDNE
ncbi:hypothetical protein V8B55DRAFT_1516818 [Mucor lusitanicus]